MIDIFLDRDGVINYNRLDHVKNWQEFKFLPGSLQALARLNQAAYRVFVVTNQAQINRGQLPRSELDYIHNQMCKEIKKAGGNIYAVLYCPHRPEENCQCRKPKPGLLQQAAQYYQAQLAGSWLIGDHSNDIEAGQAVGCQTMLVLSGRSKAASGCSCLVAPNLAIAVEQIIKHEQATLSLLSQKIKIAV